MRPSTQRKWRLESPRATGDAGVRNPPRGRAAPLVPYHQGHFMAVPCAARRHADRRLVMGVSLGGLPPAARSGSLVDRAERAGGRLVFASGLCARGRRRMGSVGGWPLAIPTTVASGGNREGGSRMGASRTGPPPVGSPGLTPQRAFVPPRVCAPVLSWGT
jgi:hypothetical protein